MPGVKVSADLPGTVPVIFAPFTYAVFPDSRSPAAAFASEVKPPATPRIETPCLTFSGARFASKTCAVAYAATSVSAVEVMFFLPEGETPVCIPSMASGKPSAVI